MGMESELAKTCILFDENTPIGSRRRTNPTFRSPFGPESPKTSRGRLESSGVLPPVFQRLSAPPTPARSFNRHQRTHTTSTSSLPHPSPRDHHDKRGVADVTVRSPDWRRGVLSRKVQDPRAVGYKSLTDRSRLFESSPEREPSSTTERARAENDDERSFDEALRHIVSDNVQYYGDDGFGRPLLDHSVPKSKYYDHYFRALTKLRDKSEEEKNSQKCNVAYGLVDPLPRNHGLGELDSHEVPASFAHWFHTREYANTLVGEQPRETILDTEDFDVVPESANVVYSSNNWKALVRSRKPVKDYEKERQRRLNAAAKSIFDLSQLGITVPLWLRSHGKTVNKKVFKEHFHKLKDVFKLMDTDGSGTLELPELEAVFQVLGYDLSTSDVIALIAAANGKVQSTSLSFEAFACLMTGQTVVEGEAGERLKSFPVLMRTYGLRRFMNGIMGAEYGLAEQEVHRLRSINTNMTHRKHSLARAKGDGKSHEALTQHMLTKQQKILPKPSETTISTSSPINSLVGRDPETFTEWEKSLYAKYAIAKPAV